MTSVGTDVIIGMMVLSMVVVLLYAWKWFGSLRVAFLTMLIVGKMWAGTLWAFGIDRPLYRLLIYSKVKHAITSITITADQFVFLSFLTAFVVTVMWPYISPHVPEPIRRIQVIESGERR